MMADEKNSLDDEFDKRIAELADQMASEYDETTLILCQALKQNGVDEEQIDTLMNRVPKIARGLTRLEVDGDVDRNRKTMAVMDLVFIGLLFHEHRDKFVAAKEEGEEA